MNASDVNEWIQNWMDDHTDPDCPEDILSPKVLRSNAVSILQFARDAKVISQEEYQLGLNPIVQRTHPELGEVYGRTAKETSSINHGMVSDVLAGKCRYTGKIERYLTRQCQ